MMKVVLFTDTYPPFINGVSTSTYNLAKTLRDHGNQVIVVCPLPNDGELTYDGDTLRIPGIELKKMYGYRITNIYNSKAYKIIKEFKPDVIHIQTEFSIGIFGKRCAKKLRIPTVYTYHTAYEDYTYYVTRGMMDRFAKHIVRFYTKVTAKTPTEYITPSEKTKEYMRLLGSDIYINVIPTGIDFSSFDENKLSQEKIKKFKKEHNIKDTTKVFLILGRIAKEKSMDVSITFFAKYVKQNPNLDIKMLVVGDGPQRIELEELVVSLGISKYVDFIGFVKSSEVSFYYHLADVYTSASVTETQGLTFMEAMVSKTIVLARFDNQLANTIIDGQTGYFFTDEESFMNKLDKILNMSKEEKRKIIQGALKMVDEYSIEKFYERIEKVYLRAIKKFW